MKRKTPLTASDLPDPGNKTSNKKPKHVEHDDKEKPNVQGGILMNPKSSQIGEVPLLEPIDKISPAKELELKGLLETRLILNDADPKHLSKMMEFKKIITTQLPNMPREYITRLVYDKNHRAVCAIQKSSPEEGASEKVVAGILYRPFQGRDFIEIVFLAVSPDEQLRGYGTYIMCQLKAQAIREKLHNLLTYADNSAIDYFKKQGFNRQIGLEKEVWGGYIKDYVDSTLMHCVVSGVVDYTEVRKTVRNQRRCIEDKLRAFTTGHWIFKGLNGFKEHNVLRINLANLKPLTDIGWDPEKYDQLTSEETQAKIHAINAQFIADVHADRNAWPFHTPVDGEAVADYYSVVKDPIDLQTMKERLDRGNYYITQEMVWADLKRMMENCKFYNGKGQYYDYAQAIERKYLDKWTPKPLTDAPVTTPASAKPATPAAES